MFERMKYFAHRSLKNFTTSFNPTFNFGENEVLCSPTLGLLGGCNLMRVMIDSNLGDVILWES